MTRYVSGAHLVVASLARRVRDLGARASLADCCHQRRWPSYLHVPSSTTHNTAKQLNTGRQKLNIGHQKPNIRHQKLNIGLQKTNISLRKLNIGLQKRARASLADGGHQRRRASHLHVPRSELTAEENTGMAQRPLLAMLVPPWSLSLGEGRETIGYEPFALHARMQWAI